MPNIADISVGGAPTVSDAERPTDRQPAAPERRDNVLFTTEGPIAVLTLNRPNKRNALSLELMQELIGCLDSVGQDSAVRVLILAAAGKVFSSGVMATPSSSMSQVGRQTAASVNTSGTLRPSSSSRTLATRWRSCVLRTYAIT